MKRQNTKGGKGEKDTDKACFKRSVCRKPFYRKNMSPSNIEDVSPITYNLNGRVSVLVKAMGQEPTKNRIISINQIQKVKALFEVAAC